MAVDPIVVAKVGRPFGIAGLVYLQSFTDPGEKIFDYPNWYLKAEQQEVWQPVEITTWRKQQTGIVVKLKGIDDRTAAQTLTGGMIGISPECLPELSDQQFYWRDLEGLTVSTLTGETLGKVLYLYNLGASDVMVVAYDKKEIHIPFVMETFVKEVSLAAGTILVDWSVQNNLS